MEDITLSFEIRRTVIFPPTSVSVCSDGSVMMKRWTFVSGDLKPQYYSAEDS